MSNLALWSRPAWDTDRWLRDFFGPAAATDWHKPVNSGFRPAAEIVKDGEDAVVRVELPGVDVENDVNVEVDKGRLVIHGDRSAGRSSCPRTSPARPSRLRTTTACYRCESPVPTPGLRRSASRSRSSSIPKRESGGVIGSAGFFAPGALGRVPFNCYDPQHI